jgi:hypothetical protein
MTEKKPARAKEKPAPKPKLTDTERHSRFVEMAHEVEADESPGAFDRAFNKVVPQKGPIPSSEKTNGA